MRKQIVDLALEQSELSPRELAVRCTDKDVDEVCGKRVPTREEIWEAVKSSPGKVWNGVTEMFRERLPTPDFSGWWTWFVDAVAW